ncbi:MAG: DUF3332 domain-containing protein [Paludibacteraceae bacterium]|nr:DUF3332 domain-containing protein [Paludibacteraceae bacterium]
MNMRKLIVAVSAVLASSVLFSSCIGSFALFNKVLDWNQGLGNKFVNELVFICLNIIPVYGISGLIDAIVLNTIEFWTGSNPIAGNTVKTVKDENGTFYITSHENGYTITKEGQEGQLDLVYNKEDNSWSAEKDGQSVKFLTFVDENHVKMYGSEQVVELSQAGTLAYKAAVCNNTVAFVQE